MINERTVRDSHGWRREKRRRCNLIRLIRPIIDHPMFFRIRLFGDQDAAHHLAKCLKVLWFHWWRANVVNRGLIAGDVLAEPAQSEAAFSGCLAKPAPTTRAAASRCENVLERTKI